MIVQSLWIGQSITRMERACIQSWVNAGYEFHLFSYEQVDNLPPNTVRRDAREILAKEAVFKYNLPIEKGGDSYSGFSNFFRYKLLLRGGVWVDTDVYCLKPLPELKYLLVQEDDSVASCIMAVPHNSPFAEYCWGVCCTKNPQKIQWGETGPQLVTEAVRKFSLPVQPSGQYFPIMYQSIHKFLEYHPVPSAYTVHFWNEMWRRKGQDKNATHRADSLYEQLIVRANHPKFL